MRVRAGRNYGWCGASPRGYRMLKVVLTLSWSRLEFARGAMSSADESQECSSGPPQNGLEWRPASPPEFISAVRLRAAAMESIVRLQRRRRAVSQALVETR